MVIFCHGVNCRSPHTYILPTLSIIKGRRGTGISVMWLHSYLTLWFCK